ncbi:MAG: TonB-dependent receptor [Balneolaceae bacterium]
MRNIYKILLAFILPFLVSQSLLAQGTGIIRGVIIEAETNEPLFGANAIIVGTSQGAAADLDGNFIIRAVPEGQHMLRVSYLGYQTIEVSVTVSAGEETEVEFILRPAGVQGDEVTITSQRRGQVAAINEQLTSNTISNIVSKDRIQDIPDVNAAESIGRLPGIAIQRSGGEANKVLIRGLSPKFSTVSVNGVRLPSTGGNDRSVDLSLVSSNMLDGIEVKKANTPDMDADAIAGSVDLKLRDAPEGLLFDFQAQGGYAQLQDYYGNYKFSGTASNRFLDNKLGIIATFNVDEFDRSADQMFAGYAPYRFPDSDIQAVRITSVSAQEQNTIRGRTGGSFLLDYKLPKGKISANTFYNQLSGEGYTRHNNIFGGRPGSSMNINVGTTSTLTSAISLDQDHGWVRYDAGVSRTSSKTDDPENYYFNFRMESESKGLIGNFPRDSIGIQPIGVLNYTDPKDSLMVLETTNISSTFREEINYSAQFNVTFPFNIGTNIDGTIKTGAKVRWFTKTNDEDQRGKTNWAYAGLGYNENTGEPTGNEAAILRCIYDQVGTLNGYNVYMEQVVNGDDSPYPYIPIVYFKDDYTRDNFLTGEGKGGFPLGSHANPDDMIAFINAAENCVGIDGRDAIREDVGASRGNDYEGEERYDAAYIMSEINIGKYITLIPGVRWEHDYSKYTAERFRIVNVNNDQRPPDDLDTLDVTRNYNFILPMVHLQIKPNDWLQIRLARTGTIARPDYLQYIPRTNVNAQFTEVNANNTDLRPAISTNYDASVSVYQNHVGLFSVSGFHKTIEDLPLWKRSHQRTDDPLPEGLNIPDGSEEGEPDWLWNDPRITTYINAPFNSEYWGVELDWQTSFWYLPSFLKGLVLNVNYTRMFSETAFMSTELDRMECIENCGTPFQTSVPVYKDTLRTGARAFDQPAHLANLTVGYDFRDFSIRVSYLYQGDRLTGVDSALNPVRDSYSATYERWDMSIRQKIKTGFMEQSNLEIFANLSNITSTPDRNLIGGDGDPSLGFGSPTFVQYYGFTMDLGLRLRF